MVSRWNAAIKDGVKIRDEDRFGVCVCVVEMRCILEQKNPRRDGKKEFGYLDEITGKETGIRERQSSRGKEIKEITCWPESKNHAINLTLFFNSTRSLTNLRIWLRERETKIIIKSL